MDTSNEFGFFEKDIQFKEYCEQLSNSSLELFLAWSSAHSPCFILKVSTRPQVGDLCIGGGCGNDDQAGFGCIGIPANSA